MAYAVKVEIRDLDAVHFSLPRQKTMYGGKNISAGDVIFVFASENEGGPGLIARGVVSTVEAVPRLENVDRQVPRVNLEISRDATAQRPLGRAHLRPFNDWKDGRPETELNFKFYRQATNKVVGLSAETTRFLQSFFK